MARWSALGAVCLAVVIAACGADPAPAQQASWASFQPAPGVIDLAGPRSDGRLVVAMGGGLQLFGGAGLAPFTSPTGGGAYVPASGESYIALTPKVRLPKAHCSFHRDDVFAIANPGGIVRVSRSGSASRFATTASQFLSAITFDRVGSFGHRLLTTGTANGQTTLYAIDCHGRVRTLTKRGPLVEGGIEVAPRGFGRLGGRLIGADEMHGPIYAFKPSGSATVVATPSLPAGGDIGVESVGFVPRLRSNGAAFLADRGGQAAPHQGTDSILRLAASQLASAGIAAGDLLVATEGGAETVAVRCRRGKACAVLPVGLGPSIAHAEGHIAFLGARPSHKRQHHG
jgi:hypothetical protein